MVVQLAQAGHFLFMPIVGSLFSAVLIKIAPPARTDVLTVGRWLRHENMSEADDDDDAVVQFGGQSVSVLFRAIASVVALGCGVSLGPTAPRAELGANFALLTKSIFLRQGSLPADLGQALWASGMAAGVAAGAKAPLTGSLFALEVCYLHRAGQQAPSRFTLSGVLLAAALAAIVSEGGMSVEPSLEMIANTPGEEPMVAGDGWVLVVIGMLAALLGLGFQQLQQGTESGFRLIEDRFHVPSWLHPAIAGFLVTVCAVSGAPEIMFLGWENFQTVISEPQKYSAAKLGALAVLKLVVSSVCQKSGLVGGLFAPALFSGAALGALVAKFAPNSIRSANLAVVGMASCLSTVVGTPVTAVTLVFELTQVYSLLPAVVVAVACSQFFVAVLQSSSATAQAPEVTAGSWGSRERWKRVRLKLKSTLRLASRLSETSSDSDLAVTPSVIPATQRTDMPSLVEETNEELNPLIEKEQDVPSRKHSSADDPHD
eukprot:gnl/MRDRNA2_/MRDRNA2_50183_c0_seq2.p1 gnl/MRDRNA2_/MRDRNA2_50183_c0~~gnl/MRDRNA2_/MRDRNA2_50183_c0_seq2.p1  ORF type:complete len:536 (-),score=100.55 gnl/MRDRNA2_/MRDRNA2_50183_c0_seq2:233-1693(-)